MAIGVAVPTMAAPSIGQIVAEAPVVISGNLTEDQQLIVQDVDTSAYTSTVVAQVVTDVNDDNTIVTMKEVLTTLGVDTSTTTTTTDGKTINASAYEFLTPYVDLVISENDVISYESTGQITATVTFEAAKGMDKSDLLIMQIDPTTGAVYFITVEDLDPETGEITATFETLGPIALITKVPIVVRDVDTEEYGSTAVANTITTYAGQTKDFGALDVLTTLGDELGDSLKTTDGVEIDLTNPIIQIDENTSVDLSKLNAAMGFADLAIKQGEDTFSYDMEGSVIGEAHRDISNVDWESIVAEGNPDFDIAAAEEDPSLLTEEDSFVIPGSVVIQINPNDGTVDIIYEPEISFAYEDEESASDDEYTDDETDLMGWTIYDDDKATDYLPNMVIKGDYKSAGPFAVFLPENE
ncbi:MAG: hypothetical protein LUG62_09920 [Clostridiales bacterium]|nr:hypothetical protein [Clostridiales bacterium]